MNTNTEKIAEDQLIEAIVIAFRRDFMCAIRSNQHDTFVVGQLSAALLEQLSGFLYPGPANTRGEQFVAEYMEAYSSLRLYDLVRICLNKTLTEKLGAIMMGIPGRLLKNGYVGLDERKVLDVFIKDLKDAVDKATSDLRHDHQKRRHALSWVRDHPVYEPKGVCLYTDAQQARLQSYYMPLLEKLNLFAACPRFSFGFNFGDGGNWIAVLIDHFGGREESTRVPLEIFIELLGMKRPEEVLSEEE
jgi:hypothetical protein